MPTAKKNGEVTNRTSHFRQACNDVLFLFSPIIFAKILELSEFCYLESL